MCVCVSVCVCVCVCGVGGETHRSDDVHSQNLVCLGISDHLHQPISISYRETHTAAQSMDNEKSRF